MHRWELHWEGEHWTWWSNEGKSNQQGKANILPDQNQHGCKKKDRNIRGIERIGLQNRKEEEGLKHKLLRFLWWMTLHYFFLFSFSKLNFVDLSMINEDRLSFNLLFTTLRFDWSSSFVRYVVFILFRNIQFT